MSTTVGVRRIDLDDLPALARGCAVLGTGGGGNVETGLRAAARAITTYGPVEVLRLDELPDDAVVIPMSGIGAPTVSHEMLASEDEVVRLREEVERLLGRPMAAVMSSEIGGSNGVQPVAWAARLGLPLVDADGMGRAFPEVQMVTMYVAGIPLRYVVLVDVLGNVTTIQPIDGIWGERLARASCVASGASALMADNVLTAAELRGGVVEGTVTRALKIGHAVHAGSDPLRALIDELGAVDLIGGKVVDVERHTGGGFVRGSVVLEGTGEDRGRLLRLEVQNENLVALEDGRVLASVPDLITVVDSQTADAISTELLRYGQRVHVLSWPCDPIWRTPRGLEIAGPRAFGYDHEFVPVEEASRVR